MGIGLIGIATQTHFKTKQYLDLDFLDLFRQYLDLDF